MPEQPDPFFERWAQRQRPPLASVPQAAARVEHAALHDELAAIDAELETLCARRRAVIDRLGTLRTGLWPLDQRCHRRRQAGVDELAMPPAPPGAEVLGGVDLRSTCLGILRRHGPCALRELHGLLHRHGYRIEGVRAVQSLADAMGYEVRQGRATRVARGVYGAVAAGPGPSGAQPLTWQDPDEDRPQLDPVVLDDPERWSAGTWPGPPDVPGSQVRAPDRYDSSTLDEDVRRARARAAALFDRPADATERPAPPDPTNPTGRTDLANRPSDRWERFVDESIPTVRTWVERRRRWVEWSADRPRRRRQEGWDATMWGDDAAPEDP